MSMLGGLAMQKGPASAGPTGTSIRVGPLEGIAENLDHFIVADMVLGE